MSNWERYFSTIISYDSNKLIKDWEKLYDVRNKIAHNRTLGKKEYEDFVKIFEEAK